MWGRSVGGWLGFFPAEFRPGLELGCGQAQTPGAQGHLGAAFFACDIQGVHALALQGIQGLQQQSGLADARIATDQTTPPSTTPPPKARSSSSMPVGLRSTSGGFDVA